MGNKHMSLESVLDQERRDVLALLEGPSGRSKSSANYAGTARASSPFTATRSTVRSMLDVETPIAKSAALRHAPLSGTNGGMSSPPIRSMLDVDGVLPPPVVKQSHPPPLTGLIKSSNSSPAVASTRSAQSSPTEPNHRTGTRSRSTQRSLSDAATRPANFGPRAPGFELASAYEVSGYLASNSSIPSMPKRKTPIGKKPQIPSAMAEVVRGGDLSTFASQHRGRNQSITGSSINHAAKSSSPHNRLGLRSNSPHASMLSPDSSKFITHDGRVLNMNSAYKQLSDAKLASAGGGLSTLNEQSRRRRTNSGDQINSEGSSGVRLEEDFTQKENNGDAEESSEEEPASSEDDRGRRKKGKELDKSATNHSPESTTLGMGRAKGPRTARSLMAAAEEERQSIVSNAQVRSLLEPEITVTAPLGDRHRTGKRSVHPNTSFDEGAEDFDTPLDSDTEEGITDIKRAQKLSVHMTSIVSTPATSRCVRTIYRGDFSKMQQEADDHHRRVRKYLVATDISDEAAHALEWTVGTVLRDGDTLLAIYCIDEEQGKKSNEGSADDLTLKEQIAAVAASTKPSISTPILTSSNLNHAMGSKWESHSANASPMGRDRNKAEQERYRAVQDITDRVSKLLRKTRLQVKVVIEVIHCKSPKHLITEIIDYISPTLVILGSRGRSALKGVILGSFSNYLVTKSSVPVMVARKRLRKHGKFKAPSPNLANNLTPAVKGLASAKID